MFQSKNVVLWEVGCQVLYVFRTTIFVDGQLQINPKLFLLRFPEFLGAS